MRSQRGYRTCREPKSNWSALFARSTEKYSDRGRTNERQRAVHPKLKTIVMASRSLGSCYSVKAVCECVSMSVTWSMTNRWNVQCKNFTQRTRELWVEFKTVWERKREREREAGGRWLCGACLNLYSDASCLAGLALSGFLVNFRACLPACSCSLGWLPLWEREVLLVSLPCAPLT